MSNSLKDRLRGSMPALVTPFKDGAVDEKCFQDFVEWQIGEGTHGLVPVGTTGESPTLNHEEHKRVVELCIEAAAGRVPVIAGAGSNATAEAQDFVKHAEKAGADAALVVTPYYNKPNQEGMYQHYKAVAECSDIPIIVYNVPGRSIVDIHVDTLARLVELPNIAGVKDASNDALRPHATRIACGEDFILLSGEDALIHPYMSLGGHGCISVTANVAPRLCADFHNAWAEGDIAKASEINDRLMPLHDAVFSDTSPSPSKYGLAKLGKVTEEVRLPLLPANEACRAKMDSAMRHAGLIN